MLDLVSGGGHGGTGDEAGQSWLLTAKMWHRISKANSMFYAKKALFCDAKLPVKSRIDAFCSTCVPAVLHGAGEWASTQSMFQALRIWELRKLRRALWLAQETQRNDVIVARQLKKTQSTTRVDSGYERV